MMSTVNNGSIETYPIINCLQRVTVYETLHSYYVIGSNLAETYFKVLKLDRTCDPKTIEFSEDIHDYDKEEIDELLHMINVANTSKTSNVNNGILKMYRGFGIVGFIRFLEGYYMILITKQIPVAIIGYHTIYTIDDAVIIYIPMEDRSIRENNLDEQRYLKLFQTVDLRQNFYYSYSYDLTHTMQYNLTGVKGLNNICFDNENNYHYRSYESDEDDGTNSDKNNEENEGFKIGVVAKPYMKFVWNDFLLKPIRNKVNNQWILNLVHGYISQSSLNIYGCSIYVTLICRRSQKYAGTRFLKRGGTNEGYVANEVETEQIVHNACVSSIKKGFFTSFVQMRGSIPLFWSQDPKQVPKPPINIDIYDPFSTVAANHFKQLLRRFGAPLVVLNLVKMREKKAQESMLAIEYKNSLEYLQQFLPDDNYFQYIYFDMAKLNKTDKGNVMNKLNDIAEECVKQTGIFQNFPLLFSNLQREQESNYENNIPKDANIYVKQNGIIRVNCVDCLDRTNTAMFVIGKCAFAHQLYALGIIPTPVLEADSISEKMLIDLYERSGDAIAQQYAGSQLVHRVDTYGKTNSIASQSRDIVHTISRYYSNAFSDADKQNAMNLFLGIYQPSTHENSIWELQTDCYLHDPHLMKTYNRKVHRYNNWIDQDIFECLPNAYNEVHKTLKNSILKVEKIKPQVDFKINKFNNFYKPHKLTVFHETYHFNLLQVFKIGGTSNDTVSTLTSGLKAIILDPFIASRNKKRESNANTVSANDSNLVHNVAYTANPSLSSGESDTDDSQSMQYFDSPKQRSQQKEYHQKTKTPGNKIIKPVKNIDIHISERSLNLYKNYVDAIKVNNYCSTLANKQRLEENKINKGLVEIPKVNEKSLNAYKLHLSVGKCGPNEPSIDSVTKYGAYLRSRGANSLNTII